MQPSWSSQCCRSANKGVVGAGVSCHSIQVMPECLDAVRGGVRVWRQRRYFEEIMGGLNGGVKEDVTGSGTKSTGEKTILLEGTRASGRGTACRVVATAIGFLLNKHNKGCVMRTELQLQVQCDEIQQLLETRPRRRG